MVGEKIRMRRKELGWSQLRLAKEWGVHQTYISQIEAGKTPENYRSLRRISKFLGLTIDELSPE